VTVNQPLPSSGPWDDGFDVHFALRYCPRARMLQHPKFAVVAGDASALADAALADEDEGDGTASADEGDGDGDAFAG
jgi:hypothetical protein